MDLSKEKNKLGAEIVKTGINVENTEEILDVYIGYIKIY